MAEKAAHLSPISQIRPSLFDYFASVSLDLLLYPICQKLAVGFTARRGSFAHKSFDELYYACYSLLQFLYLKSFGATFSEKFYGLKREPLQRTFAFARKNQNGEGLKGKELFLSMITICLFPYVKQKLNQKIEDLAVQGNNNKVQTRLVNLFKILNGLLTGAEIIQSIRYLSGTTNVLSLLHKFSRVKLIYQTDESPNETAFSLKEFLPNMIKVGVFFYQFLQMMPIIMSPTIRAGNKMVEPPSQMQENKGNKNNEIQRWEYNKCPLCGNPRRVETVLSTSGYVFCFSCITSYLMKNDHCPVTKIPSSLDNLINLYPPT